MISNKVCWSHFGQVKKEIRLFKVGAEDYQNCVEVVIVTFCTFTTFCVSFCILVVALGYSFCSLIFDAFLYMRSLEEYAKVA